MGYYSSVNGRGKAVVQDPSMVEALIAFMGNDSNYLHLDLSEETPLEGQEVTFTLEDKEVGKFYDLEETLKALLVHPALQVTELEVYRFGEERNDVEGYFLQGERIVTERGVFTVTFPKQGTSSYFQGLYKH